jgi:hypothetical protein
MCHPGQARDVDHARAEFVGDGRSSYGGSLFLLAGRTNRVFSIFSPFTDHFSPFPTIFPIGVLPKTVVASSTWPRPPIFAPLENGENGVNGRPAF